MCGGGAPDSSYMRMSSSMPGFVYEFVSYPPTDDVRAVRS